MKGLLLKDWYQVRSSMKTMYLVVVVVLIIWMFGSSSSYVFPVSYAAIFLGILPVNLLTYDQSVGWVEYGQTLPVSKKTLVAEKYLVGLLCAAAAIVVGGIFVVALILGKGKVVDGSALFLMQGSVCIILLVNGISLPLLYRFGAEKARMIYFLTFAGFGAMLGGGGAAEKRRWLAAVSTFLAGCGVSAGGSGLVCRVVAGIGGVVRKIQKVTKTGTYLSMRSGFIMS